MKALEFPAVNIRLGEGQPQYETLPAAVYDDQTVICMGLSDRDIQNVIAYGKVWVNIIKPHNTPFAPISLGFVDDVYDNEIAEPRWGFDTEEIEVEPGKATIFYSTEIKLTFWQRLKHLFTGKNLQLVGSLDVEAKYSLDFVVKNITTKDVYY